MNRDVDPRLVADASGARKDRNKNSCRSRSFFLSTASPSFERARCGHLERSPFDLNHFVFRDSPLRRNARVCGWLGFGRRTMSRGYSFDLRERAIALVEGGLSRRAAAHQLMISPSSSVKWFQRFAATGSFAEKPTKKLRPSPLDDHADWLLALVAGEPDLTLAEIEVRLLQ
jgi:transposase-like protein